MVSLLDLPTEIVQLIISELADLDFGAIFVARQACKTLDNIVTNILSTTYTKHGLAIHAFLKANFSPLLDSSTAKTVIYYHHDDIFAPIRCLPWASQSSTREKWLRPEATWYRIPLVSPSGNIVRRLQVVAWYPSVWESAVTGDQVHFWLGDEEADFELQPAGGITIGWLYDTLLKTQGAIEQPLGDGWEVLFEREVQDLASF
ncbi:hypothetical protein M011DRAFT_391897, partial [Sporormia fimetaria CBS 119925]